MDKIRDAFNTFPYYALPLAQQRMLVMILVHAQSPKVLLSGTFPLNMELFVTVRVCIICIRE